MYTINFTVTKKEILFKSALQWSKWLFVCEWCKNLQIQSKDSEIVATPLCLGNILKEWSADNMKKTGFNGYVYDFSVDYDATDVDDIVDIRKYLMKKIT